VEVAVQNDAVATTQQAFDLFKNRGEREWKHTRKWGGAAATPQQKTPMAF